MRHDPHDGSMICRWCSSIISARRIGQIASTRRKTFEGIINYLADLAVGTLGRRASGSCPFSWDLHLYLTSTSWTCRSRANPFGGSPTADLNTTAALALFVFFGIQTSRGPRRGSRWRHSSSRSGCSSDQPDRRDRPAVVLAMRLAFNISPAICRCSSWRRSSRPT